MVVSGTVIAVAAGAFAPTLHAQIPGVAPMCADRPLATGQSMFAIEAVAPDPDGSDDARPASDLHCIDVFATGRGGDAAGVIELSRASSPFGVSVTPDGVHRWRLTGYFARLPDPATLGRYGALVAWVTPLDLDPVVKLGEVRDGRIDLGEVAFNKFLVLVTAEGSADVTERTGPLVVRGRSPSSRMEAHDLTAMSPAAMRAPDGAMDHDHGGGAAGAARGAADPAEMWEMPPMYDGIPMLPGVMAQRPRVSPLRPTVDIASLPEARERTVVDLPNGGTLDLTAGWVRRTIEGRDLVMLGFNEQIPGPLIRVREASTIFVNFTNETPMATAVHWHGIRLENAFDGVPGITQDPVEPGETFQYRIHFPDAGIYWYHPHHREDVQQELGLAGNLLVDPLAADYWAPVNRDEVVMLDDILLGEEDLVPFGEASSNYMLMGRFGNVLLANGEPEYRLEVDRGEVVRFHLTNASNTRTFNLSLRREGTAATAPLPLKVVASDVGKFEREVFVESVAIAPAERYVVEVHFPESGTYALTNRVQGINHRMGVFLPEYRTVGSVSVSATPAATDHAHRFETLRTNDDVVADIDRYREHFDRAPDHELLMTLRVDSLPMAIEQSMNLDWIYFNPVEWTGTMPVMNWATSGREVEWILRDRATGAENMEISWGFAVGDVVKIRVTNDRGAFHAMQHPLHIHGQRFLVLEQNGVPNDNLVWKDTVLLPSGSTTDILLELSNPGRWMVHCHIAEHLESGMTFVFDVEGNRP